MPWEREEGMSAAEPKGCGTAETAAEQAGGAVRILPMRAADVKEVHTIEKDSFPSPWPRRAFLKALQWENARFITAFEGERVVGYAGIRLGRCVPAHIVNIAVHRDYRRRKIGGTLLSFLVEVAARHGARCVILEVRASNTAAQEMYRKFGFEPVALRKKYYVREREDAIVMAKDIAGRA